SSATSRPRSNGSTVATEGLLGNVGLSSHSTVLLVHFEPPWQEAQFSRKTVEVTPAGPFFAARVRTVCTQRLMSSSASLTPSVKPWLKMVPAMATGVKPRPPCTPRELLLNSVTLLRTALQFSTRRSSGFVLE